MSKVHNCPVCAGTNTVYIQSSTIVSPVHYRCGNCLSVFPEKTLMMYIDVQYSTHNKHTALNSEVTYPERGVAAELTYGEHIAAQTVTKEMRIAHFEATGMYVKDIYILNWWKASNA